jgi:hypothetical protein
MLKDPENADKLRRIASMFASGDDGAPFIPAGRENRDGAGAAEMALKPRRCS